MNENDETPTSTVRCVGWKVGFSVVQFTGLLRGIDYTLLQSKEMSEQIVSGNEITVCMETDKVPYFVKRASEIGIIKTEERNA